MPAPQSLTSSQKRHLRALAHNLTSLVQIGKHGWTEGARAQVDEALLHHELIKVKVLKESPIPAADLAAHLVGELGAQVAQQIGHTLVVYRRHPKEPKIQLPRPKRDSGTPV